MALPTFRKADRTQLRLRLALAGPAGSGKTYTALAIASAYGGRIAVIDTEHKSASKYAGKFDFDVLELESFHPDRYIEAMTAAVTAGYDIVVIDSLSPAWDGKDGALELVDRAAKRGRDNSFVAWRDVTPIHNRLCDAMVRLGAHLIVTLRTKTEYVVEKNESTGKSYPRKIGLAPIQRAGLDYEFDVVADMDYEHNMIIGKTRCEELDGKVFTRPGADVAGLLRTWLTTGTAIPTEHPSPDFTAPSEHAPPVKARYTVDTLVAKADHVTQTESPLAPDAKLIQKTRLAVVSLATAALPDADAAMQEAMWRGVLTGLFNQRSVKDLSAAECDWVNKWIGSHKDGDTWHPNPAAVVEAVAVFDAWTAQQVEAITT